MNFPSHSPRFIKENAKAGLSTFKATIWQALQAIADYNDRTRTKLTFVFFLAMAIAYARFWSWEPTVFFADDLSTLWAFYDGNFASTIQQSLFSSFAGKYRPVFQILCHFLFLTFDKTLWLYLCFNFIMQGINSVLFFLISSKLAGNKCLIPFILTAVFASSKFALYQITQVSGPVESVALAFFLSMLYALLRSLDDPQPVRWQWLAILCFALTIYTHERYVVIMPWLAYILFNSVASQSQPFIHRCSLVIACLGILCSNYLVKTLFLHIPFFVGTGGYNIYIDIPMIITHIHEAFFSLFGFNDGPAYLIGNPISINPIGQAFFPWLMALFFSISCIYVISNSIASSTILLKRNLCYLFAFISLISLLLIPPIFTIRVEGRWEYAPFALILLSLAWAYGLKKRISSKKIGLICILASMAIIIVDNHISSSFDRIYMVGWAKFGGAITADMVPPFVKQRTNKLLLLADKEACGTVIINRVFELYTNKKPLIFCAETQAELTNLTKVHPDALAFEYNNLKFTNVTQNS